ncbi:MAG: M48 family metallopeptidase [Patescibacteria group bacterium]
MKMILKPLANSSELLRLLEHRIDVYNRHYRFDFYGIKLKRMKSRWGSCSRKKNLNFNTKLALLPMHLIDYVIVHELCHLREFNHSRKFWELVALTLPDWKSLRKELRTIAYSSDL